MWVVSQTCSFNCKGCHWDQLVKSEWTALDESNESILIFCCWELYCDERRNVFVSLLLYLHFFPVICGCFNFFRKIRIFWIRVSHNMICYFQFKDSCNNSNCFYNLWILIDVRFLPILENFIKFNYFSSSFYISRQCVYTLYPGT